jgi:hypothetical protein
MFDWAAATRTGGKVAIAVFVVGCLAAIGLRAFLRFAEGDSR